MWSIRSLGRYPHDRHRANTALPSTASVAANLAEALTGASRAAVSRNLAWLEARGLIREVTGQGRFRMWCTANCKVSAGVASQLAVAVTASARQGAQKITDT
jgi:Fe2+ or Zn2+ uptake regulation protein